MAIFGCRCRLIRRAFRSVLSPSTFVCSTMYGADDREETASKNFKKIGPSTFTRDDQVQAQAYLTNRALLYQVWDLATTYPNIASKIRVRVRKADPRRDYRYDDRFADAAIVVSLSWIDAKRACEFLNCVATYPRDGKCRPGDDPRVYPSGDYTTVTACQPACFMLRTARTSDGRSFDSASLASKYKSSTSCVMSARSNEYYHYDSRDKKQIVGNASNERPSDATTMTTVSTDATVDMPMLEYVSSSNSCESANASLFTYVTQPYFRAIDDGDGSVCRLTNFSIGDDLKTNAFVTDKRQPLDTLTGRHSRTYCDGFDKEFDEKTSTCYEPWWEHILSFTFVSSALMRLARHAIAGGNRCDTLLPTAESRQEINVEQDEPDVTARSRYHWFRDVDRTWCLPPPNVLLSDLGIEHTGQTWSNENGGTLEIVDSSDYSVRDDTERARRTKRNVRLVTNDEVTRATTTVLRSMVTRRSVVSPLDRDRCLATKLLQRDGSSFRTTWDLDYVGRPSYATSTSSNRRRKRDRNARTANGDVDERNNKILDFDVVYDDALGFTGSQNMKKLLEMVGLTVAEMGSEIATKLLVKYIVRSAYSRALRFIGRDLTGYASRTLIGLGLRVTTARLVSAVFARFSTRIMTALSTTASGVGIILSIVELVGILLDFMMLFGWDPGNYKSEFNNDVYDDMAIGWLRKRRFDETVDMDPILLMSVFQRDREGAVIPDGGGGRDESAANDRGGANNVNDDNERLVIRSRAHVPWFFEKFSRAIDSMINDLKDDVEGRDAQNVIANDNDHRAVEYAKLRSRRRKIPLNGGGSSDEPRANPLTRIRPILTENTITTNILLSMHYFAHRPTNSLGQRVEMKNDAIRLDDATVANAVRDNELASLLGSAYTRDEVPREILLAAARRNVVSKSANYVMISMIIGSFVWTLALLSLTQYRDDDDETKGRSFANVRERTIARTENKTFRVAIAVAIIVFFFVLPLTMGIFFLENVARDKLDRSFERQPAVRRQSSAKRNSDIEDDRATIEKVEDVDAIDRVCDFITESIRSSLLDQDVDANGVDGKNTVDTTLRELALRSIVEQLRPELRVIYNM